MNLVNLESVSHAYGPRPLLDGVSLGIAAGDRIGVVGRNGGGKTTLISIVCGLVRATDGEVLVEGAHRRRDYKAARQRIGLVPQ